MTTETLEHLSVKCAHCDDSTLNPLFNKDDERKETPFCCNGCRAVYNLLNEKGLSQYYSIKNQTRAKGVGPVQSVSDKYSYLDDEEFIKEFCTINENGTIELELYLEGVHCLACLWLIEKTPEFIPGLSKARLDLGKAVAHFTVEKNSSLSLIAHEVSKLGYRPHPIKSGGETAKLRKKEERKNLLQIGIAGACSGNTMLYAVGLYAGADGLFAKYFEYITFVFSLPVLFYSATPFYKGTISALKRKHLSIDVPIAFALWAAFISSTVSLFRGTGEIYYDLIATLVFLMLLSRYFMRKASQKGLEADSLGHFFNGHQCLKKDPDTQEFTPIHSKYLASKDIIKVLPGEIIPADGIVLEGLSAVNTSLLTGESIPQKIKEGDQVFSGSENQQNDLIIKVEKVGEQTRVGEILKKVEKGRGQRAPIVGRTDEITKYFVGSVLLIALGLTIYFSFIGMPEVGFQRALSLIIISCPCALGLATPLAMTKSLSLARDLGVIVKEETILEKISKLKNLVIDKTGTLTYGRFSVETIEFIDEVDKNLMASICHALESKSKHPIAKSICEYIEGTFPIKTQNVEDFEEVVGLGVLGTINSKQYSLRTLLPEHQNLKETTSTQVGLYNKDKLCLKLFLTDKLRDDAKSSLDFLSRSGIKTILASGDNKQVVYSVAKKLGLKKSEALFEMTPESKGKLIDSMTDTIMVGDGANDALALGKASLGIAVQGSVDISLRAADAYLTKSGIFPLVKLLLLSKETIKLINRNLFFSLAYNALGAYAAIVGQVSPLWAAIFMPASSLTVLLSTLAGTRMLRKLKRM